MSSPPAGFDARDRQSLVEGCRAIGESGTVIGSAGNLSMRQLDRMLITPRGAELDDVDPVPGIDVALPDGTVSGAHQSGSRPSSELHRAVYATAEANAARALSYGRERARA
jgi:ribulose-5-phosphate 4-epimerase/fuculose-1-phosphate aldolase